jgi:hypothetical protein
MVFSDRDTLSPQEELDFLQEIYGQNREDRLIEILTDAFNVLQNRAQMLLSLITITLTITGFSGPQIAQSSLLGRVAIICGLFFVLLSALVLMAGPLRLTWCTRRREENIEQSLVKLIVQRNRRTDRYHLAAVLLVIGLIGYVGSVISFLAAG